MTGLRRCCFTMAAALALVASQPDRAGGEAAISDANGSGDKATSTAQKKEPPKKLKRIVYKPPRLGAPTRRLGGATRAPEDRVPVVIALATQQGGTTSREQPTFYWYLSAGIDVPIAFTIVDPRKIDPLTKLRKQGPLQKGFWKFSLTSVDKKLEPGIEYEWYVALILDSTHRSKDVVSSGTITLVRPAASTRSRISETTGLDRAYVQAEEGLWYDALETLTAEIMLRPRNSELRGLRADLFEQVELPDVADYDREKRTARLVPIVP